MPSGEIWHAETDSTAPRMATEAERSQLAVTVSFGGAQPQCKALNADF